MTFAPGALVKARGREWVVLPDSDDEILMVRPLGGTDDETTGLLLSIEGADITPATFPPPNPDRVGDFRSGRLLRDALRLGFRSSVGPFRSLGRIAVDPRPYQLVPLLMSLKLDPVRMLIADDVGIGKTIEALLIARELYDTGEIQRMAVLCSPQLAEQWQREMNEKFHLDAVTVLPSTVRRLERGLRIDQSLFDAHPVVVISTDFIKSDRRRYEFLNACPEFVIVDEAHTAVDAAGGRRARHQRHELLRGLAADGARHLVLVTATPHSGNEEAFRALLCLLDEDFALLPDDLSGRENEANRRRLAGHFVQRRRADIRSYLGEDTTFPERETTEATYRLSEAYRGLFDRAIDIARATVTDEAGGQHQQRVRWWSALALLRSIASSPAAAADTLRNRAAAAETADAAEADDVGRRTVLDLGEDEAADAIDVTPGSDLGEEADSAGRYRRRLLELARDAERLPASEDTKLQQATTLIRGLIKDGFNPIVFCRFIPTAEYVAEELRKALGDKVAVEAVTGTLPPDEREARVNALASEPAERRVLVATDCLSEGVNLQHNFDAVVHYDLSWNPTKHEQREGRCDRFGQPSPTVRTVTFYGVDNQIDGIVLDVLIRKHQTIRNALGISVPVPSQSDSLVEALMEGLLLRGRDPEQLQFDAVVAARREELFGEWERAAERERRSRTMFAQQAIKVEEVAAEVAAAREAVGSASDIGSFLRSALPAYGGRVIDRPAEVLLIDASEATDAAREAVGHDRPFEARLDPSGRDGAVLLSRTHPIVENLSALVLDDALDELSDVRVAARSGAIRTQAVDLRTTLLLVRFRFTLVVAEAGAERSLLAEDAAVLGFTGAPDVAEWLPTDAVASLLDVVPDANIDAAQAAGFVARVVESLDLLRPELERTATDLGEKFEEQHRRVRDASRRKGVRFSVEPHLPPDLLGVYVLLPSGGG